MRELSLHILDIIQNSLTAGATVITIHLDESPKDDLLRIEINDNGKGIPVEQLDEVNDPFYTSRSTRKVGLGISLFKAAAERSGGEFLIKSQPSVGTTVVATFLYHDIDRAPLGNMADTILALVMTNPSVDFYYWHRFESNVFTFDTKELAKLISRTELENPMIAVKVQEFLAHGIRGIYI